MAFLWSNSKWPTGRGLTRTGQTPRGLSRIGLSRVRPSQPRSKHPCHTHTYPQNMVLELRMNGVTSQVKSAVCERLTRQYNTSRVCCMIEVFTCATGSVNVFVQFFVRLCAQVKRQLPVHVLAVGPRESKDPHSSQQRGGRCRATCTWFAVSSCVTDTSEHRGV